MKAGEGFHDLPSMRSPGQPMGWIGITMMAAAAVCVALSLSGCVNLFSGVDHPSGDAQLISAARACLDAGDYQCAMNDYQQLSSAQSDIAYSEEAYTTFAQDGAGMQAFAGAFGNGSNVNLGTGLTEMANSILAAGTAGASMRLALYNAFANYQNITDNTSLSALVEFLGSTAIASEILAEMAETNGQSTLTCSDIATGNAVANCPGTTTGPLAQCFASTTCGGSSPYFANAIGTGTATFDMLNAALLNMQDGITRLSGSGTLTNLFNSAFSVDGQSIGSDTCGLISPTGFIDGLQALSVGGC